MRRQPGEPRLQVVRVHPGARVDRRDGGTYRPSVLAHLRTLRNSPQRDLMSRWNVLPYVEGSLANLRTLAAHEADWCHGDVIHWIKAQQARKSVGIVVAHQVSG
jgi:hypothetical protein